MTLHRRQFLNILAGSIVLGSAGLSPLVSAGSRKQIKAVAFDAFPIFDPRPIFALAEELFPGKGGALSDAWRTRQFEYQWLRALGRNYADFWKATEEGLEFAARQVGVELGREQRERLMQAYLELKPWPDVVSGLQALASAGIRLAFLSNMTPDMLRTNVRRNGLEGYFEHLISTDRAKTYKPDPQAYQLGLDVLKLKRQEIAFAAFAGWDVAGAKWFGYPTFWVNRAGFPPEVLDASADGEGKSMNDLIAFVGVRA